MCYFQYINHIQMKDYTNFAECSRICFGQIRTFYFRDWSRVMFCFYSLVQLPMVARVFLKARLFTYFLGNQWEMFRQSVVQLVCRAQGGVGSMLDIYASRFSQNSLRARSLVSPPQIIKLEPFDTIEVRDYLSALAVLCLPFPPFVNLSPILPFLPSLAYFSSNSSNVTVPLAILETVWMSSCECSQNLRYFFSNFPISTIAVFPSSASQTGQKKQGFIILVTTSPFSSQSMKICSSLIRSTSFPSCLKQTKALTISASILVTVLSQRVVFL